MAQMTENVCLLYLDDFWLPWLFRTCYVYHSLYLEVMLDLYFLLFDLLME
jgi:hypothetical protein